MAIGHLTSDYVAFVFNNPIENVAICAQNAAFPVSAPLLPPGLLSLAPSIYTAIPSTRSGRSSNFWRVMSPTGGNFVITQRAPNDPAYPSDPTTYLDTYMYLWNNTKTSILAQNDDGGGSWTSLISYYFNAGQYYLIECTSWASGQTFAYRAACYRSGTPSDVTGMAITSI